MVDVPDADADDAWAPRWHQLLLSLAGRLPDDLVSEARAWLAAGLRLDVAQAIAFAVTAGNVSVGAAELLLVRAELATAGHDTDIAAALDALAPDAPESGAPEPAVDAGPLAWEFHSTEPAAGATGTVLPLDLTGRAAAAAVPDPPAADPDAAMVAAVESELTVVGLWRAWRLPAGGAPWPAPKRVYVVTVDRDTSGYRPDVWPLAVADRLGAALETAGEPSPQVEVCLAGREPPPYQVLARSCGALLWARQPATRVTIARVFDEVDPVAGPRFAAARPRLADPAARADLLARLEAGTPVLGTSSRMVDVVDPARGEVVPMTFRTDGHWIWTDTCAYYLDQHGVLPDPDLVRHLAFGPAGLLADEVAQHRVLAHLLGQHTEEPVWVVPQMGAPLDADRP
ncbi:hypothetical protein [Frankia sp. AgB32]|uniref:hypothetical protein n=1 Tax=Frankia sp. AgB32 TaxID=631119 RepID=UPI0020106764|nr:hypothetical protein [Frankia sp. AgB32]MCK9896345.1 hypothetical protein [Frankia sp. AgB32]